MILIDELYKNYNYYLQIAYKVVKKRELAEDVIQALAIRILSKEATVKNIKAFISQCIYNQALNIRQANKRYFPEETVAIRLRDKSASVEDVLIEQDSVIRINVAVNKLPKKQKKAVSSWYGIGCDVNRKPKRINYDTNKANVRWALTALKKKLNKEDFFISESYNPGFLEVQYGE